MTDRPNHITSHRRQWQRRLSRVFGAFWVEASVGLLVFASVVLTLLEFALAESRGIAYLGRNYGWLTRTNDLLTVVFVVELLLRYLAATSLKSFLRIHWLDIIAVLPVFRIFRTARAVQLLRLFRLLRMLGVISRLASHFPYVFRRGAIEYTVVCGMLMLTVIFGAGAMTYFEGIPDAEDNAEFNLENSFWYSLYTMFAGEPTPQTPSTVGGKVVTVFVMFMGLTIFAMFTGTVAAFMVERLRTGNHRMNWDDLNDHVIICGWNNAAEIIAREYRAAAANRGMPMVVITQWENEPPQPPRELEPHLMFYNDDFTRVDALERVGVHRASTCVILSDTSNGRSEQDADARTILGALTVEKLNPDVYTCAELCNRSHGTHLQMGHVNDYVVSGEYGAYLLAQAAMNRGLMDVFTELLTYQHGNEFYRMPLPEMWLGQSYMEVFVKLKSEYNAVLVSVHNADGELKINPAEHVFAEGDEIVVIAEEEFRPSE